MKESKKMFNPLFIKVCLVNFMLMMGQQMANTLIPKYADYLGASSVIVGMITGIFSTTAFIIHAVSGQVIDVFEKRRVIFVASLTMTVAFVGYTVADNITLLIIARLLQGCGVALTVVACLTLISQSVSRENITTAVAFYAVAGTIAQAIGPSIGLTLMKEAGYKKAFLVATIIMAFATLLSLTLDKDETAGGKINLNIKNIYAVNAIIPATIMIFLSGVNVNISSFLVLFAGSIGVEDIQLYFTVNAIALLLSKPLVGKLSDKYGTVKILPWAIISLGVSMFLIGKATGLMMILIAAVFNAFGYGACQPMIQSLCVKSVSNERRGAACSTCYSGTDIGYTFGPIITGTIVKKYGYRVMFTSLPLFLLFALIIFFVNKKKIAYIDMGCER